MSEPHGLWTIKPSEHARLVERIEGLTRKCAENAARAHEFLRQRDEAEDSRDEWKLRAERAEQERGEISEQLAKMDAKWRHAYNRLADYEDHGTTDQFSRLRRRAEKAEAERDAYRELLVECKRSVGRSMRVRIDKVLAGDHDQGAQT